jgi:hypothetical protein
VVAEPEISIPEAARTATPPEPDLTIVLRPAPEPAAPAVDPGTDAAEGLPQAATRGRHRAPAHAAPSASSPSGQGGEIEIEQAAPPARRRRLLVAGLTVVDNSDVPPETPVTEAPAVG